MTVTVFPGTFAQALQSPTIRAGDVLLLHGGTYSGSFTNTLAGIEDQVITIRSYPGEHAVIDGVITVNGSYVVFQDLEIIYSGWVTRQSAEAGSSPSDIPTEKTLTVGAERGKFINCIIHDVSGPSWFSNALGGEFYGCVIYHVGWNGTDRGHGHGLYVQNDTPEKIIKDCIIFDNFGWGIHAYTQGGTINNIVLEGNTCFRAGSLADEIHNPILYGGSEVANNPILRANMTYVGKSNLGYLDGCTNAIIEDNYMPDGLAKINVEITSETGNYYGPAVGNRVFLRVNDYDPKRAHLIIYNEAQAGTIEVDVSRIYKDGDKVQARNVQDYFTDIQTLTVTAGKITVNMQAVNRTVATPIGWTAPATTFPQFGCFVLEAA